MSSYVIVCGGTGGHLVPGIALATELQNRGHQCTLVVSSKQIDQRLLSKYSYLDYIKMPGTYFSWHPIQILKFIFLFFSGFSYSLGFLPKISPDAVIGFGGFTTVSIGIASRLLGYPLLLHEANRVPGRSTRLLRGIARRIYLPKGMSRDGFAFRTVKNIGYPLREEMVSSSKREAKERLGFVSNQPVLLVLGGSQGASALNKWVEENISTIGVEGIGILAITGIGKGEDRVYNTKDQNRDYQVAQFMQFSDNMPELLSAADLVVCRSGAGTLAELVACKVASIMVPYPTAADNHQLENARFHERQGAGIVIEESNLHMLCDEVRRMIYNPKLLSAMRNNLDRMSQDNALLSLVEDIEQDFSSTKPSSLKKVESMPPFPKESKKSHLSVKPDRSKKHVIKLGTHKSSSIKINSSQSTTKDGK